MTKNQTRPSPNGRNGDGHLIDLREVVKTFQTAAGEFTALEDINLQVEAGEYVGVVGKSGSGKSTLPRDSFQDDLVKSVRGMRSVAAAEARPPDRPGSIGL